MCLAMLLLLLSPTLLLSLAEPPQERVPLFRLTQRGPWEDGDSNATGSPCEGIPAAETTSLTLVNRSLERLPSCLPRALRSLDASHNLLNALSAQELGALPQLQVLTLRHNHIVELRWGPGGPADLHKLDLSYNRLAALPLCDSRAALRSLRALHLAGNPLRALQPGAFSCFPALRFLNLSSTELGYGGHEAIAEAAFAGVDGRALETLEVLDLSGTFLTRVHSEWIRDLPNLTSFYLRKMPRLRNLEGNIFKMTPNVQRLDCQDSPALISVHTHIFEDTPRLQALLFQNCNLSSFPPWTLDSSQVLSINLFGNPLTCSCELSWLLLDTKRIVLNRAADTVCTPAGSSGTFSASLTLSQLPTVCQSDQNITRVSSTPLTSDHSTHTPSTQGLMLTSPRDPPTLPSTTPCSQPGGGRQSVTKAPSLPMNSLVSAAGPHSSGLEGAAHSTTISTAGSGNSSVPPRAAGTVRTEHRAEHTVGLVGGPSVSAVPTPFASKQRGTFPTSGNPVSPLQPNQGTTEAPHSSPTKGRIPIVQLDDYREEEEEEEAEEEEAQEWAAGASQQDVTCDYNPCKHLQTPCAELQRRLRCRCPGISREDTVPDPPKLQGVSEVTDTSALIHWCAPNSVVDEYQIHYHPEGRTEVPAVVGKVHATVRQHPLVGLAPATTYQVCILAANRAGLSGRRSSAWRRPCTAFTTRPSSSLVLAALGACSGLLLLSTLVLAGCLYRRVRTPHPERHHTHLVAYKNPAFDYPLKLQTFN
ncbi:leucine-rich repeat neuronal protein 4 [Orycteropus afer afer]|uniref:Leucine-rich repeat neuronal protein 4 n=1 Tax=Orycteropus afer afer TaxID=1230840 RepID=A0A8B7ASQ2_ORYAF|nr:leucine-rich repeat neuronal protein 4 [Orycteropus afer afer]